MKNAIFYFYCRLAVSEQGQGQDGTKDVKTVHPRVKKNYDINNLLRIICMQWLGPHCIDFM